MTTTCKAAFCKLPVAAGFKSRGLCVEHFVRKVEAECEEIRREALSGRLEIERRDEVRKLLSAHALELVRLGTSGVRLTDATRCHILSTVLMLMNASERVARLGLAASDAKAGAASQPLKQPQGASLAAPGRKLAVVSPSEVVLTPPGVQPAEA